MTRLTLTALLISAVVFAVPPKSLGEAPQTQTDSAQDDTDTSLPQGHPQLPADPPELPQGHPDLPQGQQPLPSGHPSVPDQAPGAPASAIGSLTLKVVQGTEGGPPITAGELVVFLYHQDKPIASAKAEVDATGTAVIEGVQLTTIVQPVVTFDYAGVTYQAAGRPMGPSNPEQTISLTAYEATDQAPPWQVMMRHVMVNRMGEHVHVTEVWAVSNPTDRSWIGTLAPPVAAEPAHTQDDGHGHTQDAQAHEPKGVTLIFPLPEGSMHVQPGPGFHNCCTQVQRDKVVNTMPLLPGISEYRVDYLIPIDAGEVSLALRTPAAVKHMMVFVPDDGSSVDVQGLEGGEPFEAGEQRLRIYKANDLTAGQAATLVIGFDKPAASDATFTQPPAPAQALNSMKLIAGLGGGALLLACVVVLLRPTRKTTSPQPAV